MPLAGTARRVARLERLGRRAQVLAARLVGGEAEAVTQVNRGQGVVPDAVLARALDRLSMAERIAALERLDVDAAIRLALRAPGPALTPVGEGMVDIEPRLRAVAIWSGVDPDAVVAEAERALRESRSASAVDGDWAARALCRRPGRDMPDSRSEHRRVATRTELSSRTTSNTARGYSGAAGLPSRNR